MKTFTKFGLFGVIILMAACSSAPKKEIDVMADIKLVNQGSQATSAPILNETDKALYSEGVDLLRAGNYDAAEELFTKLLDQHSNLAGALVNLGLIEQGRNNSDKALVYFKKALSVNPKNVAALIQLGTFSQKSGRFQEAEAYFLKAYEYEEGHSVVNYNLGVLYELYLQDYSKAIDHYENYVKIGQGDDIETVKRWIKLLERK